MSDIVERLRNLIATADGPYDPMLELYTKCESVILAQRAEIESLQIMLHTQDERDIPLRAEIERLRKALEGRIEVATTLQMKCDQLRAELLEIQKDHSYAETEAEQLLVELAFVREQTTAKLAAERAARVAVASPVRQEGEE